MAIICSSNLGWLLSHSQYISTIYDDMPRSHINFKENLFKIYVPYIKKNFRKKRKVSIESNTNLSSNKFEVMPEEREVNNVENIYNILFQEFRAHFEVNTGECDNKDALALGDKIYEETGKCAIENADGLNIGSSRISRINDSLYVIPENCRFFCRDVAELPKYLSEEKFDLILLDPPWWNKYIRRKRKRSAHGYNMMYNNHLKELNLENLLSKDGLVVVWCTNSSQHINALKEDIFPKWGLNFTSKWYWLKITQSGQPICNFSSPPGKQPFEQIVFGCRSGRQLKNPPNEKVIMSVPSALHSHKPPLVELLKMYLPEKFECLEIFARYLLPNWTSYGNEVLKFQHESLYNICTEINETY